MKIKTSITSQIAPKNVSFSYVESNLGIYRPSTAPHVRLISLGGGTVLFLGTDTINVADSTWKAVEFTKMNEDISITVTPK